MQCCLSFRCTAKWISYTCIHSFFFRFYSHIGHYRVLSKVPCTIQQLLIIFIFCTLTTVELGGVGRVPRTGQSLANETGSLLSRKFSYNLRLPVSHPWFQVSCMSQGWYQSQVSWWIEEVQKQILSKYTSLVLQMLPNGSLSCWHETGSGLSPETIGPLTSVKFLSIQAGKQ